MKRLFLLYILFLPSITGFCQTPDNNSFTPNNTTTELEKDTLKQRLMPIEYKHGVYFEFLGAGFGYSFNYRYSAFKNKKSTLFLRGGMNISFDLNRPENAFIFGLDYNRFIRNSIALNIGINSTNVICYKPNPSSKEERIWVRNNPNYFGEKFQPPHYDLFIYRNWSHILF